MQCGRLLWEQHFVVVPQPVTGAHHTLARAAALSPPWPTVSCDCPNLLWLVGLWAQHILSVCCYTAAGPLGNSWQGSTALMEPVTFSTLQQ